ncbi:MAG: nucleotidyl transferase AbiEii/AbiGii toxin family protein [Rhodothermia bacterium]|nr:MAG: nucleotidyl transferase AbiEii/AbiGii toxin family protein [Rhodothermia bacterium]
MPTIPLPDDFSEFLKLLKDHSVRYLLIGGYAVAYHGYVRSTADLGVWVEISEDNAVALVSALNEYGFSVGKLSPDLFLVERRIVRMGLPPFRIEVLTTISGLEFQDSYKRRIIEQWGEIDVSIIDLVSLKVSKRAAGRHQDLDDLENLP